MYITPIIPQMDGTVIDNDLFKKAETVVIKSAQLIGGHNIQFTHAVKDLLRITNSYYSNRIESEGTHPLDIEKAMKQDFSQDEKKKSLQELSLIHIEVEKYLEQMILENKKSKLFDREKIKTIHNMFYSKPSMAHALNISHRKLSATMIPGEFRESDVEVGEHIAPAFADIGSYFNEFETLYNQCTFESQTMKLIYILCSHHRLVYIHPFYDGNGRISRLFLDYLLQRIELEGYGLWNLSRGLAREQDAYFKALTKADELYSGGYDDGRGRLSLKGLKDFLHFMLDTALDQIEYMSSVIRMDLISKRIMNYVEFSRKGMYHDIEPLPKHSEKIFQTLLLEGEIPRNSVKDLLGVSKPTAIKIVKELEGRLYLTSDEAKSPIKIRFNSHFASEVIPELFPKSNN